MNETGNFKVNIDERELAGEYRGESRPRERAAESYAIGDTGYYSTDPNDKEERKNHRKRNRLKARKNKRVFRIVWICMVLLAAFTLSSYLIGGANDFFAVGRNEGTTEVELPEKVDAAELARLLYARGAIAKPEFFELYSKVTVDDWDYFQKGKYEIGTNLDYEDILNRLQGGNESRELVTVTFPEGSNALEIGNLLEESEVCTQAEFLKALGDLDLSGYDMIAALGDVSRRYFPPEGYLFPDTYDFWKGEELESVVGKLLYNFQNRMSDTMEKQVEQSGFTLDQIVVLASMIQAEAADSSDMFRVSAVLHNRLDYGWEYDIYALQCDSTIFYPYRTEDDIPETGALPYGRYNTYEIDGLPAGAICNPGLEAINAALNPSTEEGADSWLYFCHDADGNAYYASNEEDHLHNRRLAGLDD